MQEYSDSLYDESISNIDPSSPWNHQTLDGIVDQFDEPSDMGRMKEQDIFKSIAGSIAIGHRYKSINREIIKYEKLYEEGYLDDAYEFVKDVDWPPKGKKSKRKKFKYSKAERLKFKAYANKLRFPPTISSIIKKKASTRLYHHKEYPHKVYLHRGELYKGDDYRYRASILMWRHREDQYIKEIRYELMNEKPYRRNINPISPPKPIGPSRTMQRIYPKMEDIVIPDDCIRFSPSKYRKHKKYHSLNNKGIVVLETLQFPIQASLKTINKPISKSAFRYNPKEHSIKQYNEIKTDKYDMGESQRHIEPNNIDKGIRFKVNIKAIGKISKVDIMDAIPQTEQNKCVNRSAVREVVEYQHTIMASIKSSESNINPKTGKMKLKESKSRILYDRQLSRNKNGKVFVFNSYDSYIKRILQSEDWIMNPSDASKYFTLKWNYLPNSADYLLQAGQLYNHMKNSHELTSKSYLSKNLRNAQIPHLDTFFPKCFDLSIASERCELAEEYTYGFMMYLLHKVYLFVKKQKPIYVEQYYRKYRYVLEAEGYRLYEKKVSVLRDMKFRLIELEDYKRRSETFTLHSNLLLRALKYWRRIRKKSYLYEDTAWHVLYFQVDVFEVVKNALEKYSKCANLNESCDDPGFSREYFSTPSNLAIERIVKEYIYFYSIHIDWPSGSSKLWISKPASSARGSGIFITNDLTNLLYTRKYHSRVVQSYIYRPLIFRTNKFPAVTNRKFDIRQWVLLKSLKPLSIYMFSHFYVRICSYDYNQYDITNLKKHLTNYSYNKNSFKNSAESVLSCYQFIYLLSEYYGVDYQQEIAPKVYYIIVHSIKACRDNMEDIDGSCFELLGYDILIDHRFNPWLLEVNMSPACYERTDWLKTYLQAMGEQLLQLVMPGIEFGFNKQFMEHYHIHTQYDRIEEYSNEIDKRKQRSQHGGSLRVPLDSGRLESSCIDEIGKDISVYSGRLSYQRLLTCYSCLPKDKLRWKHIYFEEYYFVRRECVGLEIVGESICLAKLKLLESRQEEMERYRGRCNVYIVALQRCIKGFLSWQRSRQTGGLSLSLPSGIKTKLSSLPVFKKSKRMDSLVYKQLGKIVKRFTGINQYKDHDYSKTIMAKQPIGKNTLIASKKLASEYTEKRIEYEAEDDSYWSSKIDCDLFS